MRYYEVDTSTVLLKSVHSFFLYTLVYNSAPRGRYRVSEKGKHNVCLSRRVQEIHLNEQKYLEINCTIFSFFYYF